MSIAAAQVLAHVLHECWRPGQLGGVPEASLSAARRSSALQPAALQECAFWKTRTTPTITEACRTGELIVGMTVYDMQGERREVKSGDWVTIWSGGDVRVLSPEEFSAYIRSR